MQDFMHWLGIGAPALCTQTKDFWTLPINILCTGIIVATSFIRVVHHKCSQSFVDTVWHFFFGTAAAAGFLLGLSGQMSHHLVQTILMLIALRGILKTFKVIKPSSN